MGGGGLAKNPPKSLFFRGYPASRRHCFRAGGDAPLEHGAGAVVLPGGRLPGGPVTDHRGCVPVILGDGFPAANSSFAEELLCAARTDRARLVPRAIRPLMTKSLK